ncbi:MAG: hypothetical protein ACJLS2_07920 [Microcella pacifica]
MIAAYVQASGRQGLESAVDGVVVEDNDPKFLHLRERGRTAAGANPIQIGSFELRYSRGIARLVFGDADGDQDGSPITVVLDMDGVKGSLQAAVAAAVDGVRAIGRDVDSTAMRNVIEVATDAHTSYLTRRKVVIAGGIVVVAGVVIVAAVLIAVALRQQ